MKYLLLILVSFLYLQLDAQNGNKMTRVYFESGKSTISTSELSDLEKLASSIDRFQIDKIVLQGHADGVGTPKDNYHLSRSRVEVIYEYLLHQGFESSDFSIEYFGDTRPVATNQNEAGRRMNRRVQIVFQLQSIEIVNEDQLAVKQQVTISEYAPVDSAHVEYVTYGDPYDVLEELQTESQRFCIASGRDTAIQGVNGTIVFFQAGSFSVKEDPNSCIEIHLTEYYSPEDIILNNLNTQSGSGFLETKGAIKLEAYYRGKSIALKGKSRFDLFFPNIENQSGYRLFSGKEEAGKLVDWEENSFASTEFPTVVEEYRCNERNMIFRILCQWRNMWRSDRLSIRQKRILSALENKFGKINFVGFENDMLNGGVNIFSSSKLGYINCDRFLNYHKSHLKSFYVKSAETSNEQNMITSIVFKQEKAILTGKLDAKGRHWYIDVPKNLKVWLVAIKKEGNSYHLSIVEHTVSESPIEHFNFELVTEKELKKSLRKIGW